MLGFLVNVSVQVEQVQVVQRVFANVVLWDVNLGDALKEQKG